MASGQIHKMKTANGIIATDSQAVVPIPELSHDANPRVYKNTPALLAIGDRCMNHNYGFYWEPGSKPYIKLPNGSKVTLEVVNGVPILASRGSASLSIDHDVNAAVRSMNLSSVALSCAGGNVEANAASSRQKDAQSACAEDHLINLNPDSRNDDSETTMSPVDFSIIENIGSSSEQGDFDPSDCESVVSTQAPSISSVISADADTE